MIKSSAIAAVLALLSLAAGPAVASQKEAEAEPIADPICRLIETSALAHGLPIAFLTRLIWQESSFQPGVTSPAGAQGVAQFMPGTAAARGLADPYDPEQAIPKAAELLADLKTQFGNLGLAAAAYNAGPGRLASWLAGGGMLPEETRAYVSIVTGRPLEQWSGDAEAAKAGDGTFPETSCAGAIAGIRTSAPVPAALSAFTAPWGVQIAGSFSKAAALATYQRARSLYESLLGDRQPMVIGGRLRSRGFNAFYRVRAPASSRAEGVALCDKILHAGGACVVLRN
jgi:Transglycosylase SLT domain/SPOR domain